MALVTLESRLSTNSMIRADACGRREPLEEPLLDVLDPCPDAGLLSRDFSSVDDMDFIKLDMLVVAGTPVGRLQS